MNKAQAIAESVAELIKPYSGKRVTLSADKTKVLGASSRMETVLEQAKKLGEDRPLLVKVPDASTAAFLY